MGSGKGTSLREFVMLVHELTKNAVVLEFGAREMASNELIYSCADNKSLGELGWHPQVGLVQGIQKMLEDKEAGIRIND